MFAAVRWFEDNAPAFLLAAMTALVVVDVTCRYFLNVAFAGSSELATAMFVWLVFVGAAGATRKLQNIAVDGLSMLLGEAIKRPLETALHLATVMGCVYVTYFSTKLSFASWEREIDMLGIPYTFVYAAIPIGFGLMGVHSTIHAIDRLTGRKPIEPAAAKPETLE
jgi:TRAP-type C4-dicarboxylate transport system permease small subunit